MNNKELIESLGSIYAQTEGDRDAIREAIELIESQAARIKELELEAQ